MNLNKAQVIGRITRDPELKSLPSGVNVCSFSIATNRVWKDKEGQKQESTEFHNIVAFGKLADTIAQYVTKGQELLVSGRMQTRSWDDKESGKKMYRTEIIVEDFQFGQRAKGSEGGEEDTRSQADKDFDAMGSEEINPDDIPF